MTELVGRLGRGSVLRFGYAAVILVLVISAVEAYRIQVSISQQHMDIFFHYVEEENQFTLLRRNLWLEGIYVRDFFIRPNRQQAALLASQLESLQAESAEALDHLDRIDPRQTEFTKLRKSLNDFWSVVNPVPSRMLDATHDQQFDFVQSVVVPRRGELMGALAGLSSAGEKRVQESAREIVQTRQGAAQRLLFMLTLGVAGSLLVALLSIRHAENLGKQAELHFAEVEQARRELKQLSARLLELEEEGRRQLARELHDELGQTLALLQIEVSQAEEAAIDQPPALRARLRRARAQAERAVQAVRDISLLLRPPLLDDLGLVPALQFQIDDFQRRSGIACEFTEENVAEDLPDTVKTCAYRVVQEALHNSQKHSSATRVQVSVRQRQQWLLVEIQDDGAGFELNGQGMPETPGGLGLLGMRERAANAGGTLLIDTAPRQGTRVAVRIPVATLWGPATR